MEGTAVHRPPNARTLRAIKFHATTGPEALKTTVEIIGRGIRSGAAYPPLILHTHKLASTAAPKDYFGQLDAIFKDFVSRSRYVHDPRETELVAVTGPEIYGQILGADFSPPFRGWHDCDDACVYLGAAAESIGLKARVVTIAPPTLSGMRSLFTHVYPEVFIPRKGWISTDAVGYPLHGLGWTPPAMRRAVWDLNGRLLSASGYFPAHLKNQFQKMAQARAFHGVDETPKGDRTMGFAGLETTDFPDQGLERFGFAGTDDAEPLDWSKYGVLSFGVLTDQGMPLVNADRIGLMAEYDDSDTIGTIGGERVVRTKMMEMAPKDLAHIYRYGFPRPGAVALSDDGDVYQWSEVPGLGGFFKKLFKRIKRGVKKGFKVVGKIAHGITKRAKKLIKKLPGGKYIVKIAGKVKSIALKAAKPILAMGKRIAPIAALVPGWGPVAAAILSRGPQILKVAQKMGIMTDKEGKPRFRNEQEKQAFHRELAKHAAAMAARQARAPQRLALPMTAKHAAIVRGLGAYYEN